MMARALQPQLWNSYSIAELCQREGIAENLYNSWSKILEAEKRYTKGPGSFPNNAGPVREREVGTTSAIAAQRAGCLTLLR